MFGVTVSMAQRGSDFTGLRVASTPEEAYEEIYKALGYPGKILRDKKLQ